MTIMKAVQAFFATDDAWQKEIDRTLRGVVNARYLPIGRGEPGSSLRQLYDAKVAAFNAWRSKAGLPS